jgi:hypothetical protein
MIDDMAVWLSEIAPFTEESTNYSLWTPEQLDQVRQLVIQRHQLQELEDLLREACGVAGIEFHEAKFAPADLAERISELERVVKEDHDNLWQAWRDRDRYHRQALGYKEALERIAKLADPKRGDLAELSDRQMIARYALKEGAE